MAQSRLWGPAVSFWDRTSMGFFFGSIPTARGLHKNMRVYVVTAPLMVERCLGEITGLRRKVRAGHPFALCPKGKRAVRRMGRGGRGGCYSFFRHGCIWSSPGISSGAQMSKSHLEMKVSLSDAWVPSSDFEMMWRQ